MRLVAGYEPQATEKFFGAAVFQKCCRGVGEQPTFAEQIKLNKLKSNKNLREHRKNRNCLQNRKVVMRDTISGAIAIPKASSLAEPYASGFPKKAENKAGGIK